MSHEPKLKLPPGGAEAVPPEDSSPPSNVRRPASVLVVDLVRYSLREKAGKRAVLRVVEEVFHAAVSGLSLEDVSFNYTGDGYFCAFLGDSSVRVLDFVNYAVPELIARLAEHKQQLRAGLDFGLVEFKKNSLIGANEVVGGPGMVATRLEEAAESGKIFCSNTVHSIFVHNWPEMFSATAHSVKCKDRELLAYEVLPMDSAELQNVFFLLVSPEDQKAVEAVMKTRRRVLVVDDEEWLLEMVSVALSQRFPLFEVETASDGREGLTKYEAAPFDLVLADINMERMDGYELTRAILNRNPEQLVVIMTGLGDRYERRVAFGLGAFDFLPKPFAIDTLYGVLTKALLHLGTCRARKALGALADEPGLVLSLSHAVASRYRGILLRTAKATDLANTMLRHKTKQVVRDFAGASEYPLSQSRARDSSGEVGEDVW